MGQMLVRATRRVGLAHVRHVRPVARRAASGLVSEVYDQVEADFGMLAPPVALHAPAPLSLAAAWMVVRETLLCVGAVDRKAKEAVAAAVSAANACPYCVEVHGATLAGLTGGPDAEAIVAGRTEAVTDPRLRALARWARDGGPLPEPCRAVHVPELVATVVTFHYLNRMVNIFLHESPLPPVSGPARTAVRRVARRIMGGLARHRPALGTSLPLLPEAPLPADLSWAAGQPHVAGALARAAAAIEAGGRRVVPDGVRGLVLERLADGGGPAPGLFVRDWLEPAVAPLPAAERPAGRLALLAAFASYRVTDAVVADFRGQGHDDRALIELVSWASLTTARQLGHDLAAAGAGKEGSR